jgi:hypothetical protein
MAFQELNRDAYNLLKGQSGTTVSNTTSSDDLDPSAYMMLKAQDQTAPAIQSGTQEEPHSLMGFLKGIPGSAGRTVANLGQLLNPMTYANLANVARGGMEKVLPGMGAEQVPMFDAAVGAMKQRYGHPLETMYHDPVGSLVDVAGLASGIGGGLKATAGIGARMGSELPNIARAGEIASRVGEVANPLALAAKGIQGVATGVGKLGLGGLGLVTGRGKAASELWNSSGDMAANSMIDTANEANRPLGMVQTSTAAMRGGISEMDSVNNMKTALQMAKDKRMSEYTADLQTWQAQHGNQPLTAQFNRVRDNFYNQLEEFRIRRTGGAMETPEEVLSRRPQAPNAARGTPEYETYNREFQQWQNDLRTSANAASGAENTPRLDFKGSGINPGDEAGAKILEMDKLFREWHERYPNPTATDMDLLKRSVDEMYSVDSRARKIVQGTKADLRRELDTSIPGYKQMTQKYHEASNFIEQLESEFSLNNKNPGVTIRKMANALDQNNDFRKSLISDLDQISPGMGDRIVAEMAGHHFSGWEPKGLIGRLGGLSLGAHVLLNPMSPANLLLLLTSPRFVGEGLTGIGGTSRALNLPENVARFMKASANPFATGVNRAAAGETGYTPTYRVDAEPANAPPQIAMPGKEVTEQRVTKDGITAVYDRKTGAYLRTEK